MTPSPPPAEIEVLRDVSQRLEGAGIPFMLTGSLALSYYAVPRMTRDIDLVVELSAGDADRIAALFSPDYYVSADAVREAITAQASFNLIHLGEVLKVDCIPRRPDAYHEAEFGRRRRISLGGFDTWVVGPEDLVLAKLLWARESHSEVQLRDVRALLDAGVDRRYIEEWVSHLGLAAVWRLARP